MNVIIFWTGVTPTMTACWRALAAMPGVQLKVFVELTRQGQTAYRHTELLEGIDCFVRFDDEPLDKEALRREIAAAHPSVMLVLGWRCRMNRFAVECPAFASVPKLFAFDMTFAWKLRKVLARFVLRRYVRRFVGAVVTGERSSLYASYLGFSETRIEKGLFGMDIAPSTEAHHRRMAQPAYPRRFIYVGRYSREKRLDLLVAAYKQYRKSVPDPWGLTCCGMGSEAGLLRGVEGISDLGFVQPAAMLDEFAKHGALVIVSDYDPWPMVVAEAIAAGLPVICTDACGSSVELVRSYFNGRVCGTGDKASIAEAMQWIHAHEPELPTMAARGLPLVAPYAKEAWAERMAAICKQAMARKKARQ